MKIVLLCSAAANQRALANRLHALIPISAIGVVKVQGSRRSSTVTKIASLSVGYPLRRAWRKMMFVYDQQFPQFPLVPLSEHRGVNSKSVVKLIKQERPDLVVVSGTDLLKKSLIEIIAMSGRIVNLHTGISPYIRGGPNCTNWALASRRFDLIGNTVMWLDAGIDSGNIIASEMTTLTGHERLVELHMKVMDHAHDLYCRCISLVRDGASIRAVPQSSLGVGKLYLGRYWNWLNMGRAVFNFYFRFKVSRSFNKSDVTLVTPDFSVTSKIPSVHAEK